MNHPVGQKRPNAWGLYDMHGSLFQRCSDFYGEDYYQRSPMNDPAGPSSEHGKLIAVDIAKRAVDIARLNVHNQVALPDRVEFLEMDCRNLDWQVDDERQPACLKLKVDGGVTHKVDVILIELPLLPYAGSRSLHCVEMPYMECSREPSHITPTVRDVIGKVGSLCLQYGVELLVPICASLQQDIESASTELSAAIPMQDTSWQVVGPSEGGFIRCLRLVLKQTPRMNEPGCWP